MKPAPHESPLTPHRFPCTFTPSGASVRTRARIQCGVVSSDRHTRPVKGSPMPVVDSATPVNKRGTTWEALSRAFFMAHPGGFFGGVVMSFRSLSSILPGIPRAESPRLAFLPLAHGSPVNALDGAVTIAIVRLAPRMRAKARHEGSRLEKGGRE